MIISKIKAKNWRNFKEINNITLLERVFIVGPNACGKSNFLDIFRFLRDISKKGGGLQKAIADRGGMSKIRCLAARRNPDIEIEVELSEPNLNHFLWRYAISIKQEVRGLHEPYIGFEKVWKWKEDGQTGPILIRPDEEDKNDVERLKQTHLEQVNANKEFRDIVNFFESTLYLHLVPQLLRHPEAFSGKIQLEDPFGKNFLELVAKTPDRTQKSRLKKIQNALQIAVPQLKELSFERDEIGSPHLEALYEHWRAQGAKQREDQFSDGTLRLIGFLWSLLGTNPLVLLEEPELSLNAGIVRKLPSLIYKLQSLRKKQVILSTHSSDLLSDNGIAGEEVLLLNPSREGTEVSLSSSIKEVRNLLESGFSIGEAIIPRTVPKEVRQLELQFK